MTTDHPKEHPLTTTTPAVEAAGMNDAERAAATAIAAVFGHSRETLDDRPDERAKLMRAGKQAVAALVALAENDRRDEIAEALFDLAHDGCDEVCVGGGRSWYDGPAARLGPHSVLAEVAVVRQMQDDERVQDHPDGTGGPWIRLAALARETCQRQAAAGVVTWLDIAREEFHKALAQTDPAKLRAALIDLTATTVAWAEAIDRRAATLTAYRRQGRDHDA